jgi:hypothetical protein
MSEFRFNVFGQVVAVAGAQGSWSAFLLGADGKRRPADFVVPGFLAEEELCQYLADLFHESAASTNGEVVRVG